MSAPRPANGFLCAIHESGSPGDRLASEPPDLRKPWDRELLKEGHVPCSPGDECPILRPSPMRSMKEEADRLRAQLARATGAPDGIRRRHEQRDQEGNPAARLVDVLHRPACQLPADARAVPGRRRAGHGALHGVQGRGRQGQRGVDLQPGRQHRGPLQGAGDLAAARRREPPARARPRRRGSSRAPRRPSRRRCRPSSAPASRPS